jgi:hypothetical protein
MTELPGPSSCAPRFSVLQTSTTQCSPPHISWIALYLMAQSPTPPASRPGSEAPEAELKPEASSELLDSLDTLLEQYLHLLDRQQKLHSGLSKKLSSVRPSFRCYRALILQDADCRSRVFSLSPMQTTPVLPAADTVVTITMSG